ncbi:MAG: NRDE family protein, partial [Myxococcota bacterium]
MCLVLVGWRRHPHFPLVVAANRDEWRDRPTNPLHRWPDGLWAGRDRRAGGTWMAVRPDGAFAAVTNLREPAAPPGVRSRGDLPLRVLRAPTVADGIRDLAADAAHYGGFHVIAGDSAGLWHVSSRGEGPTLLPPGVHGVSNGPRSARWPKVEEGVTALAETLDRDDPDIDTIFDLLADRRTPEDARLPDTGVGLAWERALGSRFVDHGP